VENENQKIILVTPVWNDSARLARFGTALAAVLADKALPVRWIIADDGSSPTEKARLEELLVEFSRVYPAVGIMGKHHRSRKGGAIRKAWDAYPEADLLAFVDADGAISAEDVMVLVERARTDASGSSVVAIRNDSVSTPVQRPIFRALSFSIFVTITRRLLGVEFKDTQCGAKVIMGPAYRAVLPKLMETGFAFDAELLLALQVNGFPVTEAPLAWTEQESGKVHPLLDSWGMLAALMRIRKRARGGWYII
jgi:hypothetical protein